MKHKIGALLGRFEPPHYGHIYMIDFAATLCEELHVLVYSLPTESIPGKLRYEAIREHYKRFNVENKNKIIIKWIEKPMPQKPEDDPDFWQIWKDDINLNVKKKIDCMFGSETYVKNLGDVLNCDHKIIDINRETVPVSGTLCRNDPEKYNEYVIPEFRALMIKKICFLGGESTGKSTLARMMAKIFKTNYVEEYGREYCAYSTKNPKDFNTQDFDQIAHTQGVKEKDASKFSNKYLMCDTDILTTQVFHKMFLNEYSEYLDRQIKTTHYDMTFLLAPVIEFDQDGTREFADQRWEHYNLLKENLIKFKREFIEVHEPDFENRIKFIKFEIIKKFENAKIQDCLLKEV